jgi:hypothetical protein
MYKRYLLKHFSALTVFIDCAMIEFEKHQLINHGNTKFHAGNHSPTEDAGTQRPGQPLIPISRSKSLTD